MTYHTSINWVKLNQSGTNRTQLKTIFDKCRNWFRTLIIQPYNWIDNCKSDGRAVLQHVRDGGSSPPNCLFNWTDDMYCAGKDQIASGARFVYVLDAVTVHIVI